MVESGAQAQLPIRSRVLFVTPQQTVAFIAWMKCLTFLSLRMKSKEKFSFVAFSGKFSAQETKSMNVESGNEKYLDFATIFLLLGSWTNRLELHNKYSFIYNNLYIFVESDQKLFMKSYEQLKLLTTRRINC